MGLDMNLCGEKNYPFDSEESQDGFKVMRTTLDLGYWRKHSDLHGYIVNTFADGEDKCQRIYLDKNDIDKIINAIHIGDLPVTTGFFFGASAREGDYYEEQKRSDLEIFIAARNWLVDEGENYKYIYYQASW